MEPQILDRWVDEKEASRITGMSRPWFQRARWAGGGIPYTKVSRACRYKVSDIFAWMEARRTTSTSEKVMLVEKRCTTSVAALDQGAAK
jgi:predicted DNA-binding transcriptional regulator AlpA